MRITKFLIAASVLFTLSACGGGGGDTGSAATGGAAREFSRAESEVTALPNGLGWTASRTVTLSNDDADALRAAVRLRSLNGAVTSSPAGAAGSYQIQVTLRAEAPTEAQAREALATMIVEHRDGTGADALYLDTEVRFAPYPANNVNRVASVVAALPSELDYELFQSTANGGTTTSGLHGSEVVLFTANGDATVSGTWDDASANTSNGGVTATGDFAVLQASTDNGAVQATLTGTRHTTADLDSDNGSIDAKVSRTLTSTFDLEGHTEVGTVSIVVAGTEPVGTPSEEDAHYRSPNYSSGNPRVSIAARTSVGSVTIHE